jgi:hypothetical protein
MGGECRFTATSCLPRLVLPYLIHPPKVPGSQANDGSWRASLYSTQWYSAQGRSNSWYQPSHLHTNFCLRPLIYLLCYHPSHQDPHKSTDSQWPHILANISVTGRAAWERSPHTAGTGESEVPGTFSIYTTCAALEWRATKNGRRDEGGSATGRAREGVRGSIS